jgi:SanA protein
MNKTWKKPLAWIRKHRAKLAVGLLVLTAIPLATLFLADRLCQSASADRVFDSTDHIPYNDVALVLGTSKTTQRGNVNLHFTRRIEAAAKLYHAGKTRHILVSGDNHVATYDEPGDMRDALAAAGVPTNAVTCDYAGFRTLDSVVRAKSVFDLTNFTIVTEAFHCPRAVWIGKTRGMNVVAFAAPDLPARWMIKSKLRETLARVQCGLDLYVLRRQPKFPGPSEPIVLAGR